MWKTIVNFKDHIHTTRIFKDDKWNEIREDRFWKKDTHAYSITFLNHSWWMTVTWDHWSWNFCRKFIPTKWQVNNFDYLAEKVQIANISQKVYEFNSKYARKQVQEIIDWLEDDWYEWDELEQVKEWWGELLQETESEHEFIEKAHYDYYKPDCIESENIPDCQKMNVQFQIICEAFNEMCKRMGE